MAKTKLEDVARLAGVSIATVSRVLNHPEAVRPHLREKVGHAVAALAYTRDAAGRALKSRRTHTVGAVVPTLGIGIFADGVEGLQDGLGEHGYTLLLANSRYDPAKELQEVQALLERGVDAIVLVGDAAAAAVDAVIARHGVPVVLTYVARSRRGLPAIGIDNAAASAAMARHLIDLGHREFGILANRPASNDRSHARLDGIQQALGQHGIVCPGDRLVQATDAFADGRAGLRRLLAAAPQVTAVLCTNDTLAMGALAEARAMGLDVPGALSITGFDDIGIAAQLDIPLTTVRMPAREIGLGAAAHLIAAIAGRPVPLATELPFGLVVRGSTGPART